MIVSQTTTSYDPSPLDGSIWKVSVENTLPSGVSTEKSPPGRENGCCDSELVVGAFAGCVYPNGAVKTGEDDGGGGTETMRCV